MDIVIVAAARTAIGKFGGALAKTTAANLGAAVIKELLKRTKISPELIEEVILGQVLTAGCGQNPARQAAIEAGLPYQVPAFTINQVCGSGLKAVILGANSIANHAAEIVIAGGQENMSASPHFLQKSRDGLRPGHAALLDSMIIDGLWDACNKYHMGVTAENIAKKYNITRVMQDTWAVNSQHKAAQNSYKFADEIVPISYCKKTGAFSINANLTKEPEDTVFAQDEGVRPYTNNEALAKLKAAFLPDGSVTAGNSSTLNDGAAAVLLMTANKAKDLGLIPLARIAAFAQSGIDPKIMGLGPILASQRCLAKAGWDSSQLDLIELNEAFAAQVLAVIQDMNWDVNKINVNGGAIALGHPIGASGCRILVSLLHEMQRRNVQKGLATLCVGGGMGVALAVER